jgi:hypothetical protein
MLSTCEESFLVAAQLVPAPHQYPIMTFRSIPLKMWIADNIAPYTFHAFLQVEVCVQLCTQPGEDVVLVGSHPALGSWSVNKAVALTWTDGHFWRGSIELPLAANVGAIEYKVSTPGILMCMFGGRAYFEVVGSSADAGLLWGAFGSTTC